MSDTSFKSMTVGGHVHPRSSTPSSVLSIRPPALASNDHDVVELDRHGGFTGAGGVGHASA